MLLNQSISTPHAKHRRRQLLQQHPVQWGQLPPAIHDDTTATTTTAPRQFMLIHIPKTAGTSAVEEASRHLPIGTSFEENRERSFATTDGEKKDMVVFLREPTAHVLSEFLQCKYSNWVRNTKTNTPGYDQYNDTIAGFDEWIRHFAQYPTDPNRRFIEACYNPWNMQSRYFTTTEKNAGSDTKNSGQLPPLDMAITNLEEIGIVGITEHYRASMCLLEFRANNGFLITDDCRVCDPTTHSLQRTTNEVRRTHGVPKHSVDMIDSTTLKIVQSMTEIDRKFYQHGLTLFMKEIEEVKKATGFDLLCRGDAGANDLMGIDGHERPIVTSTLDSAYASMVPLVPTYSPILTLFAFCMLSILTLTYRRKLFFPKQTPDLWTTLMTRRFPLKNQRMAGSRKQKVDRNAVYVTGFFLCIMFLLRSQFSRHRGLNLQEPTLDINTAIVESSPNGTQASVGYANSTQAKFANANSSALCDLQHCHLSHLQLGGPVYLWTMVASSSVGLLAHFLEHYIEAGVPAENMNFLINIVGNDTADTVHSILEDYRIDVNKQASVYAGKYHSNVKRDAVNTFIRSLPTNAWLTYTDLDEFFFYPCTKPEPFKSLCGIMIDRIHALNPNITIPAIDPNPSSQPLRAQFPQCTQVREKSKRSSVFADNRKHMLFPVRPGNGHVANMKDSHTLAYRQESTTRNKKVRCNGISMGRFDHYAWTAEQMQLLQVKAARYGDDKFRAGVYSSLMQLVEHSGATGEWSFSTEGSRKLDKATTCCPKPPTH